MAKPREFSKICYPKRELIFKTAKATHHLTIEYFMGGLHEFMDIIEDVDLSIGEEKVAQILKDAGASFDKLTIEHLPATKDKK